MPFEHVHNIVRYVREGQAAGVDRFVIRVDRRGNCIFDLYELNYYAYDRAIADPDITADEIRREWYEKHYPARCREALIELDRIGWEMVCKTYFIHQEITIYRIFYKLRGHLDARRVKRHTGLLQRNTFGREYLFADLGGIVALFES